MRCGVLDRLLAQEGLPTDGPPWLVALGIVAGLAGTTSPAWVPAVTRRLRGDGTTDTTNVEGPAMPRQDAALALVERLVEDLQEAVSSLRADLAGCTSREAHLRHERDTALRELNSLSIENEQLRYRLGEGPTVRAQPRATPWA